MSFFDALPRRKLSPRMDLRPLRSSDAGGSTGGGGPPGTMPAGRLLIDLLREKKGIPDGVRRGVRRLDRDRPGEVVTRRGGGTALSVLVLLDVLDALIAAPGAGSVRWLLKLSRILELVVEVDLSPMSLWAASPAISLVDAAVRLAYSPLLGMADGRGRWPAERRSVKAVDSFIPSDLGALPLPNEMLHLRVAGLEDSDEVDVLSI